MHACSEQACTQSRAEQRREYIHSEPGCRSPIQAGHRVPTSIQTLALGLLCCAESSSQHHQHSPQTSSAPVPSTTRKQGLTLCSAATSISKGHEASNSPWPTRQPGGGGCVFAGRPSPPPPLPKSPPEKGCLELPCWADRRLVCGGTGFFFLLGVCLLPQPDFSRPE